MTTNIASFELVSTLRYDPNFTTLEYDPETRRFLLRAPCNELLLEPKDTGYEFPNFGDYLDEYLRLETVRHETTVSKTKCFGANETDKIGKSRKDILVAFNEDDVANWPKETEAKLQVVVKQRLLFLDQQLARLNYTLKYFQSRKLIEQSDILKVIIQELIKVQGFNPQQGPSGSELLALLHSKICYKVRILVSLQGHVSVEVHELPQLRVSPPTNHLSPQQYFEHVILNGLIDNPHSIWDVFLDRAKTKSSCFTTFKTTSRAHYNAARERLVQRAKSYSEQHGTSNNKSEILLFNEHDQAMEGSITNFALCRQNVEDPNAIEYITPPLNSGCLCGIMRYYLLKRGLIREGDVDRKDMHPGDNVLLFNGVMGCVRGVIRE